MSWLKYIPVIRRREYVTGLERMVLENDEQQQAYFRLAHDYPAAEFPQRIEFQFDRSRIITRDPITTRIKSIMPYGID